MPIPGANEAKDKFLSRCMGYPDMQQYESKQRFAMCNSIWERSKKEMGKEIVEDKIHFSLSEEDMTIEGEMDDMTVEGKQMVESSDVITISTVNEQELFSEPTDECKIIVVSDKEGIAALYNINKHKILKYIFDSSDGWDEIRAQAWIDQNKVYIPDKNAQAKRFTKILDEEKVVYGCILVPDEIDLQGDIETKEEIRKAAHKALESLQEVGEMHKFFGGIGKLVEWYLAPVDFVWNGIEVKEGSLIAATKVLDNAVWQKIKNGELVGYSMGYTAVRVTEEA